MRSRWTRVIAVATLFATLTAAQALAAGTWYSYDVTVPRFHGETITNNEPKQFTGQAEIWSGAIGSNYTLNIILEDADNNPKSSWWTIDDGTRLWFDTTAAAGTNVHMRFQTQFTDPVDTEAYGNWSPDTP